MKIKILILILLSPFLLKGQSLSGYVKDSVSGSPLIGVNVAIGNNGKVTDINGFFKFSNLIVGENIVVFSCLGFKTLTKTFILSENSESSIDVFLMKDELHIDEVIVLATRSGSRISDIPGRINMLTASQISMIAAQNIDDYLQFLPGVQVSRSFGIFSTKSSVTMRGLSGNEQARTLVLLDGVPINKADGGSVNWNLISTNDVNRVEVVKSPGSALYGGNAMGGIINVITSKPTKGIQGNLNAEYGTYNTMGLRLNLSGILGNDHKKGFFWSVNTTYLKSDGYITQSEADQKANPFIVNSTVDEKAMNLKFGYGKSEKFNIEASLSVYDGLRGTGEKVFQPEGNTTEYLTYQFRTNLNGKICQLKWNTSLFFMDEHYMRVNEYQKDDYTWYDVNSLRRDFGLLTGANYEKGIHSFTAGFDIRNGRVDASDIYYTSPDKVDNNGKMNFYAIYIQDDISLSKKFKLLFGLRYDVSTFFDGEFKIYNSSAETEFLRQYEFSDKEDVQWGAFSPRISLQYKPIECFRVYGSYSRGFRPSVLDDLCRTGRIKGGLKVANPDLTPEYLDNFEIGSDFSPLKNLNLAASAYYSIGKDFLYYVSTGDSIDMGFGDRPIMIRSNISGVNIYGLELDLTYNPLSSLTLFANYGYCYSQITDYFPLSEDDPVNLKDKYLTDVPQYSFSAGAFLRTKIVNTGLSCRYTGEMFVNDQNTYDDIVLSNKYPAWFTVDLKFSHEFSRYINASLNIQNIFDEKIYDSKGAVCPGRFITLNLGARI